MSELEKRIENLRSKFLSPETQDIALADAHKKFLELNRILAEWLTNNLETQEHLVEDSVMTGVCISGLGDYISGELLMGLSPFISVVANFSYLLGYYRGEQGKRLSKL